ncbi:YtxH domain-containing protein [Metabacillus herbersteinensis]|uniref:YtxH domain-containing protein n=1 Tax=Metabacillus herbersteinensis TaxID=283816 RepID=A0ABV6G9I1_9BACI
MSKDGINSKDFIIGSLVGGIIGAATALFLAPKSGKELRDDLGQQATVVKDRTGKFTNEALEKSNGIASMAKEKTSTLSQVVTEQSSQIMNKVRDLTNSSKENGDVVENMVVDALTSISDENTGSESVNKQTEAAINELEKETSEVAKSSEDVKAQINEELKGAEKELTKTNH